MRTLTLDPVKWGGNTYSGSTVEIEPTRAIKRSFILACDDITEKMEHSHWRSATGEQARDRNSGSPSRWTKLREQPIERAWDGVGSFMNYGYSRVLI